jgi:ornithine cyclodeaminase
MTEIAALTTLLCGGWTGSNSSTPSGLRDGVARVGHSEVSVPSIGAGARRCSVHSRMRNCWAKVRPPADSSAASSRGPAEIDNALVAGSRFIVDSREGVLAQGGEFRRAREAGLIDDDHIVAEIGEVLAGRIAGRQSTDQVTVYKSLGHVVQDLASAWALYASSG